MFCNKLTRGLLLSLLVYGISVSCGTTKLAERGDNSNLTIKSQEQNIEQEIKQLQEQSINLHNKAKNLELEASYLDSQITKLQDSLNNNNYVAELTPVLNNNQESLISNRWLVLFLLSGCVAAIVFIAYIQYINSNKLRVASRNNNKYSEEKNQPEYRSNKDLLLAASRNNFYQKKSAIEYQHKVQLFDTYINTNKSPKPVNNKTNQDLSELQSIMPKSKSLSKSLLNNSSNLYISSEEELIDIYNQNPRSLSHQVIKVTASIDSIEERRSGRNSSIFFRESGNYNYWIIQQPELEHKHYFLVPKPNLVINNHTYQTIEDIFECQAYQARVSNKFKLLLPAIVKNENSGWWLLVEPGKLIF